MRIKLEKRENITRTLSITVTLFSVLVAMIFIGLIFQVIGVNPVLAYIMIFHGSLGSIYGLSETIVKTIPILLCSTGLAIAFRAAMFNIGAEGQLLMGAIASTYIALYVIPNSQSIIIIPLMFIMGFAAGALWALIPAILKTKLSVNEVITTLMMNYIAEQLTMYLTTGPWRGVELWGFPYTENIPIQAYLPCISGTRIHYPTLIIGLCAAALIHVFISRSKIGYEIRVVGGSREAARYAGISYVRVALITMAISGGLAGVAGVGEVAGIHHRLSPFKISSGYGYTAIIAAWLGKLNPIVTLVASFFIGTLLVGGDILQVKLNLPYATVNIFNGVILLFIIGGELLLRYRVRVVM